MKKHHIFLLWMVLVIYTGIALYGDKSTLVDLVKTSDVVTPEMFLAGVHVINSMIVFYGILIITLLRSKDDA